MRLPARGLGFVVLLLMGAYQFKASSIFPAHEQAHLDPNCAVEWPDGKLYEVATTLAEIGNITVASTQRTAHHPP
jgi:hypothetical protein